jgi:hypothetical protein
MCVLGVFFGAKRIEMSFCPGSSGFGFASLQFFFAGFAHHP